jgi:hypothetical protein
VFLALAACGGDSGHPVDAAPRPDAPEMLRRYRVIFFGSDGLRLPGVEVCVRERPDLACVTGDANGFAAIFIPRAELSLTFTLAGHEQMLLPIGPEATGEGSFIMRESAEIEAALAAVGLTFPGAPLIAGNMAHDTAVSAAGGTATISVAADGPIYSQLGGLVALDPALTATTEAGFFVFGNTAEGDVEVTLEHPTLTCSISPIGGGWVASSPNGARVPAVNGFDTVVVFECL